MQKITLRLYLVVDKNSALNVIKKHYVILKFRLYFIFLRHANELSLQFAHLKSLFCDFATNTVMLDQQCQLNFIFLVIQNK